MNLLMKFFILLNCTLFYFIDVNGQLNNVWVFGRDAGIDFNNTPPVPIKTNFIGYEATASICNKNGKLMFYTNGTMIWDRNFNLMPKGEYLSPFPFSTTSTTQGTVIVPVIGDQKKFYVFSLTERELGRNYGRLYYSIVDMDRNDGLGDIDPNNKGILLDSNFTEKMTAIVGDRCNIWLILHEQSSNNFKAFEITKNGINKTPIISSVGNSIINDVGAIISSTDGKKIVSCNLFNPLLEIYDFDPVEGIISNAIILERERYYSAAFSPDNLKLYVCNTFGIYQFDLSSTIPLETKTLIAIPNQFGDIKLGPDQKIYFNASGGALSVIHNPNGLGSTCQYESKVVENLPGTNFGFGAGFPDKIAFIPNYEQNTHQVIDAPCFGNVNPTSLTPRNDSGWDYVWNTGAYGIYHIADTPGTYWVSYRTPPCNFNVDTFVVHFPNGILPQLVIQAACAKSTNGKVYAETYPGDTVQYHYIWMNEAKDTLSCKDTLNHMLSGQYFVHISTFQCDTLLSFMIPEEHYTASFITDSFVCIGEELIIANTSDAYFNQFEWDFGDQQTSSLKNPKHKYTNPGPYSIRLIAHGSMCSDTAYRTIYVDTLVPVSLDVAPLDICVGERVNIAHHMNTSTIRKISWDFGDGSAVNEVLDNNIIHSYNTSGAFPVTLTADFRSCPEETYSVRVQVWDMPKVDLGKDQGLCEGGSPIYLKNLHDHDSLNYDYLWSTGDTASTIKVVTPGSYKLTVIAEPIGCSATESITIHKDCYLDIPNAFTPNGDGLNDYFFPRQLLSGGITRFHMQIFNRNGQKVFETMSHEGRGWDGKLNGQEQPQGVYVYIIEAETTGGSYENYQGNVTLMR